MRFLIGVETCSACGEHITVVTQGNEERNWRDGECERCGQDKTRAVVWLDSRVWPEVDALVRFDDARLKLKLPSLEHEPWH